MTCDLQDPVTDGSEELRKAADEVPITCPMLVTIVLESVLGLGCHRHCHTHTMYNGIKNNIYMI